MSIKVDFDLNDRDEEDSEVIPFVPEIALLEQPKAGETLAEAEARNQRNLELLERVKVKNAQKKIAKELEYEEEAENKKAWKSNAGVSAGLGGGGEVIVMGVIVAATAVSAAVSALDSINKMIEAHKSMVGEFHRDFGKPVVEAIADNVHRVHDARILAVNDTYLAVANGRNIELHKLDNIKGDMEYDGGRWNFDRDFKTVLAPGNTINIHYRRDGGVVAQVQENRQERQHEKVLAKGMALGR